MVGSYIFDASKGETPESAKRKRDIARALLQGGRAPQNVGEGLNSLGDGIVAAVMNNRADRAERAGMDSANAAWGGIANMFGGGAEAAAGTPTATVGDGGPAGSGNYRDAIAGIESGGRYDIVGPDTKGDRPYGKYQVMGANVGPWTEQVLGKRMSPQEFLASPEAQDKVFDGIFGGYVSKYGPEGAAQAWFGGPGSVGQTSRKDVLGTSVGEYGKRFIAGVGGPGGEPTVSAQDATKNALFVPGVSDAGMSVQPIPNATPLPAGVDPNSLMSPAPQVASLDPAAGVQQPVPPAQGTPQPTAAAIASNGIANLGPGRPGEKKRGPDGRMYQYVETTGMAGADGANGWIPVDDAAAGVQQAMIEQGQDPNDALSQSLIQLKQNNPDGATGPVVPQAAASRVTQALVQPQQVAQADMPMGGGVGAGPFPPAPPDPNSNRGRIAALLAASGNQWMPEGQQAIVKALIGEEMKKADPAYKLQLEKAQLELDAMRNPKMSPSEKANYDLNVQKFGSEEAVRRAAQADTQADNERADNAAKLDVDKFDYEKQKDALPEYYDAYVKQETAAGRQPLGILDFITTSKKAGAQNITVGGTTVEGEKKYDQTVGEGYGKRFVDMQDQAQAAQRTLNSLDVMQQAMADPGFYSGTGAGAVQSLKRFGASMGMDPNGIDSIETFSALAKQAALDSMGGSLGTGFSNADRDFVTGQVPSLDNSPQGNTKLIDITRKLNVRKQEIAQHAREYAAGHNGRIDGGFDDHLAKWADANPLFPKAEQPPTPQTEADFNALPSGTVYIDPEDGKQYKKP